MSLDFVHLGISHIGASVSEWVGREGVHLPDGIDHILFLLALALGSDGLWRTLKTATGFTLGHSLTLALAAFGVVRPPERWVESAIALSIAYLAIESLYAVESRSRWRIAAAFGLVHGFGFASALQKLELPRGRMLAALLEFNMGVEIGQVMILLALVPLVTAMRKEPALQRYALRGCSLAVFGAGAYWFLLRALFV